MEKMFVHIAKKTTFTEALQQQYTNSIVFIKDTQEIWTHGTYYAIPDTYKDKITSLESAVQALQAIYGFTTISDGENTYQATASAKTIKFTGAGSTTVKVSSDGVTITGKDYSSEIDEAKSAGTAASAALNSYKQTNDAAVEAAQEDATQALADAAAALAEAQAKVASVKSGSNGIAVNGTATNPTVALKLDNSGNVKFTEGAAGLSASVTIPEVEVPVKGVVSGDKVISLAEGTGLLSSTLKLKYDSTGKKLQLLGIGDAVIHEIDATAFVKDGMISNIEYDQDTHTLSITFNTDAGDVTIDDIDLSDLVDVYEEGNGIEITSGNKINVQKDPSSESYLTVGAAGVKVSGIDAAIATAKEAVGKYTVNGQEISTNPVLDGSHIALTGYTKGEDSGSVATSDTVNAAIGKLENQIAGVKTTADVAVKNVAVTNGTYVSATVSGTTTKTITIDDSGIESLFGWAEL